MCLSIQMPLEYYLSGSVLARYVLKRCNEEENKAIEQWLTQNPTQYNTLQFIAQTLQNA
ncbi:MAG: hypothetical protein VXX63_07970 [Bacteroidota bacterium]|nr:hypothetical protein [Bacteroidota bacterium]